jgi:hypothetical protein
MICDDGAGIQSFPIGTLSPWLSPEGNLRQSIFFFYHTYTASASCCRPPTFLRVLF